ncbi:MAG: hypothetical protein PHD82_14460 [Candidatus Riflebacteria bacterium]|nr:hypothetical protein [Candidatus Riflebacteria bacterium]
MRERILKALCELVGRKDAAVFQSADNFERLLQKIGGWKQLPEISALKAGLQERIPWELQKGAVGPVSRTLVNSLAGNLGRKRQLSAELAVWAVESWAISLGLKVDAEPLRPSAPSSSASPAGANQVESAGAQAVNADAWDVNAKNRAGIIFGTDAQGVIKVFRAWWVPAPVSETAGMAAVAVKAEKPASTGFFLAAPVARRKSSLPGQAKLPADVASRPGQSPESSQPSPVSNGVYVGEKAIKPASAQAKSKLEPVGGAASKAVAAKPSVQVKQPVPPAAPVVLTGSAEELCAQAKSLLPGYGTRVDIAAALQMLQQAAKLGSIPARRMIGEIYHKGLGVKQDFATAANWFKLAAESGDAHAQFYLGTLYQCGMGVEFNLARAQDWLQKAANQGHKEAKTLLNEILQA